MDSVLVRNENLAPLTPEQLRKHCPAVFATSPDMNVSSRYGFASTAQLLTALEGAGFVVVEARNYLRRTASAMQHTKHVLRLRRAGNLAKLKVGDIVPQVVLVNSHDRSSLLEMYAAAWRLACSNGLIVSTKDIVEPLRLRHTNRLVEEVMDGVKRIAGDVGKVADVIQDMTRVKINQRQQLKFAQDALVLRCSNPEARGAIDAKALLVARREADEGDSVWHVYNRVQENMVKGGIASTTARGRNTTTKPVLAVNADLSINAGLWELAMAAIAKAKA